MQQVTIDQFRALVDAGGVQSVTLSGDGGGFHIRAETRRGTDAILTTQRGQPRCFRSVDRSLKLLREMGVREARIDTRRWDPDQLELTKKSRPDASARMRRVLASEWLLSEAQAAIDDKAPARQHEEVMDRAQAVIESARNKHAA